MSDSAAGLRRTISSASDLQTVVRTMKALAASSIGQYEQSVIALADYDCTVEQGLSACLRANAASAAKADLSFADDRRQRADTMAIVFGSDQGLVGQFNETITDFVQTRLSRATVPTNVWAVGERVFVRLVDAGIDARGPLVVPQSVKGIAALVGQVLLKIEAAQTGHTRDDLHGRFNRLRQSSIDAELFDVISGFEALAPAEAKRRQNRSNGAR